MSAEHRANGGFAWVIQRAFDPMRMVVCGVRPAGSGVEKTTSELTTRVSFVVPSVIAEYALVGVEV
jgi:hypothetical protein